MEFLGVLKCWMHFGVCWKLQDSCVPHNTISFSVTPLLCVSIYCNSYIFLIPKCLATKKKNNLSGLIHTNTLSSIYVVNECFSSAIILISVILNCCTFRICLSQWPFFHEFKFAPVQHVLLSHHQLNREFLISFCWLTMFHPLSLNLFV